MNSITLARRFVNSFSLCKGLNSTAIVPKRGFNSNSNTKVPFKANSLQSDSKFSWKVGALVGTTLAAIPLVGNKDKEELPPVPGENEKLTTIVGEGIARAFTPHNPCNDFYTHLTSVLCDARNPEKQIPVHIYVSHINEDVMQALIMDGESDHARLLGMEYIITPKIFERLNAEERKLWHSLNYLVRSGVLVAPRLPSPLEHTLMKNLAPNYAKAIYMWDEEASPFQLESPSFYQHLLMMEF